jgi:hypothetical protein
MILTVTSPDTLAEIDLYFGGPPGTSISTAAVNTAGHLILTLTNGATMDAGAVVGPPGVVTLSSADLATLTNAAVAAAVAAVPVQSGGVTEIAFAQGAPAAVWTIVHNLGIYPAVRVVDSSGALVEGSVTYQDANTVIVSFSAGFSGTAYLS